MIIPTKFSYSDAGKLRSKRPKQRNDCSVRAFALATNISYDMSYNHLKGLGRRCNEGFHLQKLLSEHAKSGELLFGNRIIKHSFPARKGEPRMCVGEFCMNYTKGRFVTRQAKHVGVVIDGFVNDLYWDAFRCVYTAFEFVKKEIL